MHIDATPDQARAILKAMYGIAAIGTVTDADRASVTAAARYIFKLSPDPAFLTPASAEELRALANTPALASEAVSFATVMALVDGKLDDAKLKGVLALATTLGVKEDFVDDIAKIAQGHIHDATSHMIRANLESITGRPWATDDMMPWFLPYKDKADPALAARFHALTALPTDTFGHAFAAFYAANKYAFPGEPTALNFGFATPHELVSCAGWLRYLAARRTPGLDLHGRDAPPGSDVRPRAAGDLQLAPRYCPQRGGGRRQRRARSAGVLACLGAWRAGQSRPVRPILGFLGSHE